jgi:hypothetical protein
MHKTIEKAFNVTELSRKSSTTVRLLTLPVDPVNVSSPIDLVISVVECPSN